MRNSRVGEPLPSDAARMTRAVPATGRIAATPGKGVAAVNVAPATSSIASPIHATPSTTRAGSRHEPSGGRVATTPPAASSQTRVGVMKYALAGSVAVALAETKSEMPTTESMATLVTSDGPRRDLRENQKIARIRIGQTR